MNNVITFATKEINVKTSNRKTKSGKRIIVKAYKRKSRLKEKINVARNVSIGVATTLGLSVGSYLLLKNRYNSNIKKIANEIKEAADTSFATEIIKPSTKSINFTIGGIGTTGKEGELIAKKFNNIINNQFIPFETKFFTKKNSNSLIGTAKETIGKIIKPILFKGYNPDAIELAKKAYAHKLKNPHLPLNFIGHSGGGNIAKDVNEILINAGISQNNIKVITFGTPDAKILKSRNNVLNIGTTDDLIKPFLNSNSKIINTNNKKSINGHLLSNYLNNKTIENLVHKYLNFENSNYTELFNTTNFAESDIKQYIRKTKSGKNYVVKSHKRKNKDRKNLIAAIAATATIAGTLGLSVGSYKFLTNRYRNKLKESAKWVANNFSNIELNEGIDKYKRLHFAVGGLTKNPDARKGNVFARKLKEVFDNNNDVFIPVDLTSSQKDFKFGDKTDKFNLIKDSINYLKKNLLRGYNPTSRELAAKIYKINKLYPGKEIAIHGFSSGSPIALEVANILKQTDIDSNNLKLIHYAGDHAGILKTNTNKYLSFHKPKDPYSFNLPFKNSIKINSNHSMTDYMENNTVIEKVKEFLDLKNDYIPSSEEIAKNTPKRKRKLVFNKEELEKEIEAYRKTQQKRKKLNSNKSIPENKKAKAEESAAREIEKARNRIKQMIANIRKQESIGSDKTA